MSEPRGGCQRNGAPQPGWIISVSNPPPPREPLFIPELPKARRVPSWEIPDKLITLTALSKKSGKIAALIAGCQGGALDAHYLGYFECFNRAEFYEAHDVLEELWLAQRRGPNGPFFKGLIQFAGAFVHLQKHEENRPRLRPSAALFKLARTHLLPYAPAHEQLDVSRLIEFIDDWLGRIEGGGYGVNPLKADNHPRLILQRTVP